MELLDRKLPLDILMAERDEVLATWPTGQGAADLDAAFSYQAGCPPQKQFARVLQEAETDGATLMQPRAGVCLLASHITLLKRLQDEGQADLLPTTIDSYTRQNRYEDVNTGLTESQWEGRSLLNGFPAVNYGVAVCRQVSEAVGRPIQIRHGTPDARLLAEITLAGGFTAFEGGGISYNVPYAKNVPLERSLRDWQYVDRLTGLYAEQGIVLNREPFGPLTGTLVPPCIGHAIGVIEALLAARQGVQDITLGYGQCGNIYQDIAAVAALRRLARRYLERFDLGEVSLSTAFHQWMGGFPPEEDKASAVIALGALVAAASRATKVITKTPHEAIGIPTAEANIAGLRATQQILKMVGVQQPIESPAIEQETDLIERETTSILESTLQLGEGDWARGTVRAAEAGVLDVPFAPSRVLRSATVPARDLHGAVRFLEFGNLPLDDEVKAFHRDALERRARAEHRSVSFQMVTDDIYAVSKGWLVGVPR